MTEKVTNTANEPRPEWLFGGNPRAIEAQEAQGQRELAASEVLPAQCPAEDRAALEAAGVVFGDPVAGDPLFVNVTLPKGWKKERTDHAMYLKLVDETGTERATIFYKAAFYDRRADMYIPKKRE
jgi:hypothetical protein